MNVSDALSRRFSCRAFLKQDIDKELIESVLASAGKAPSGTNSQPWQVAIVRGDTKNRLGQAFEQAFRASRLHFRGLEHQGIH